MPTMPWQKGGVAPPQFLGKDEKLPLMLSLFMGFQHALACVGIKLPTRFSLLLIVKRASR